MALSSKRHGRRHSGSLLAATTLERQPPSSGASQEGNRVVDQIARGNRILNVSITEEDQRTPADEERGKSLSRKQNSILQRR